MKRQIHCAHNLPISTCIEHWIEFCEITGNTIEQRAIRWALGDDTGTSSKTLCAFMMGINESNGCRAKGYSSPPSDSDDRARCIRLLRLIPEWLPRLPQLAQANPGGLVHIDPTYAPDKYHWEWQIKRILQEGGF